MTKIFVVVATALLLCSSSKKAEAQILDELKHVVDTIRYSLDVRPRKFLFSFDNRRTFANDQPVRLNGIRLGLEYNNVFSKFVGFYELRSPIIQERVIFPYTPFQDTIIDYFDFRYLSVGIDYTFYETRRWQFSTPIQLGIGTGNREAREKDTLTLIGSTRIGFFPLEVGVFGVHRFYDWLGFGVGLGYRTNLGSFFSVNIFEGVYYSYGIKLYTGPLYRTIFKKNKASSQSYLLPHEWQPSSQ